MFFHQNAPLNTALPKHIPFLITGDFTSFGKKQANFSITEGGIPSSFGRWWWKEKKSWLFRLTMKKSSLFEIFDTRRGWFFEGWMWRKKRKKKFEENSRSSNYFLPFWKYLCWINFWLGWLRGIFYETFTIIKWGAILSFFATFDKKKKNESAGG